MRITRPVEIEPVTRLMYWSKDLEKLWQPRIARIRKAYNKAELETVIRGDRRIYVYHIRSDDFEGSYDFLRDHKLDFYPTNKSAIYQGFSHKHRDIKPNEPWILYGGAARRDDAEAGKLFTKASTGKLTDHTVIGELLGYPSCCIDFFNTTWAKDSIDPMFEAALNTEGVQVEDYGNGRKAIVECHPYCNNMLRYFGIRITPHLPHSLQCEKTIEMGHRWIEVMKDIDSKAADWAIEIMSMPLIWNCYKGVAVIDNDIFKAISNSDPTLQYKVVENRGWNRNL